ncbi:MAG: sulfite exporter TauE/SafE family protein [Methanocorpusculum sp.]|nr:sulfite exporter TauE/SafE family protein [Methanocorpusculum sp.]
MSGLLGVGGGFIFAPVMYFVLKMSGVAPETAILVAFGTSLAAALPTVLTSTLGYTRIGNVIWSDATVIGIAGIVTGYIGGTVATYLPVAVLTCL